MKKGDDKNLSQNINLASSVSAPVSKGQKLGEVIYTIDGNIVGSANIIASDDVCKISLWNMTTYLYDYWYKLMR